MAAKKDLIIYVLIKQVPDTKSKAGVNPDGTIDRAKAGKMLNPFDAYALEAALNAKAMAGPNSKVIAVTMGPPPAVEILYQALEQGVDKTCILSDRKLAASDTLATAYALWKTLEYLFETEGKGDLIFAGLQTTDGDTAQVGPQISERLDFTQITYCEDFSLGGLDTAKPYVDARKVIEGGSQEVRGDLPALITVANSYQKLKYKSFRGAKFVQEVRRSEELQKQYLQIVDLEKVKADPARCGLPGSPTIVSMTWKIGVVGGNCKMHQGKSAEQLVTEVINQVNEIKEFANV